MRGVFFAIATPVSAGQCPAVLRAWLILLGGGLACLSVLAARSLPGTWIWLSILATLSFTGSYAVAVAVRRTLIAAALDPGTRLRRLVTGRIGAAARAAATALATVPTLGYVAMTGARQEVLLVVIAAMSTAMALAVADRQLAGRIRAPLRLAILRPAVIVSLAAVLAPLHMWVSYAILPIPHWVAPDRLARTVADGLAALPPAPWPVAPAFQAIRAVDALMQWLLAQPALGGPLPLVLALLKGAAVQGVAANFAADAAAACLVAGRPVAERPVAERPVAERPARHD